MGKMGKVEELNVKISTSKEILSAYPTNNVKNINIYKTKLEELKTEFMEYEKMILKEMKSRVDKMSRVKKDPDLVAIEEEVKNIESILFLTNEIKTSYEKMGLDRAIHNLQFYYQRNLKVINEAILYCLRKFKEIGISLKLEDFCYSKYVRDYLTSFFMEPGEVDLKKIQAKFEEIYWKCPNLITHVELNIRYLYLKNEKFIDRYYAKKQIELLGDVTPEDIINRYMDVKKQLEGKTSLDKGVLVDNFIQEKLKVQDYSETAIEARYVKFIAKETYKSADAEKLDQVDNHLRQLFNSVYEYKMYLKYKFVVDDVRKIYKEKEKYRNACNQTKKEIAAKEKEILRMGKKLSSRNVKKAKYKLASEQDKLIVEVRDLYRDLDRNRVYDMITTLLNDNSTIKDALYLASSFYGYIFQCMRNNNTDTSLEEVDHDIMEIRDFMIWPYSAIINNIGMLENKEIHLIIKDRYQLSNINISKQDLEEDNLDIVLSFIKGIEVAHAIRKNEVDTKEIGYICQFKKILSD